MRGWRHCAPSWRLQTAVDGLGGLSVALMPGLTYTKLQNHNPTLHLNVLTVTSQLLRNPVGLREFTALNHPA